jgi:hypothetical protein
MALVCLIQAFLPRTTTCRMMTTDIIVVIIGLLPFIPPTPIPATASSSNEPSTTTPLSLPFFNLSADTASALRTSASSLFLCRHPCRISSCHRSHHSHCSHCSHHSSCSHHSYLVTVVVVVIIVITIVVIADPPRVTIAIADAILITAPGRHIVGRMMAMAILFLGGWGINTKVRIVILTMIVIGRHATLGAILCGCGR